MSSLIKTLQNADKSKNILPRTVLKAIADANGDYLSEELTADDLNRMHGLVGYDDIMQIIKITSSSATMGHLKDLVDQVNASGKHVAFDLSALGSSLYLCSAFFKDSWYRLFDLVTGKEVSGFYKATDTIKSILDGASHSGHHYTVRWDKTLSACTRLNDAANITANTANFGYFGSVNQNYDNPFDSIYPWSGRKLCNIDIDTYYDLADGADITECVTYWEGDEGFSYSDSCGVWVYTPAFYGRAFEAGNYRYFDVSDEYEIGNIYYPAMITGRYLGARRTLSVKGTDKTVFLPVLGAASCNYAMSTMHAEAKAYNGQLVDIYQFDASALLFIVEYADINIQNKIGGGVSSLYTQSGYHPIANTSDVDYVDVTNAFGNSCDNGAILHIGTSDGGTQIRSCVVDHKEAIDGGYRVYVVADDLSEITLSVTTDNFVSIHGLCNKADSEIGSKSGYIGTNNRVEAYYRGEHMHGNKYQYTLGIYRQKDTGHVWVSDREDTNDYDALNTAEHTDTGLKLVQGPSGTDAYSGYAEYFGIAPGFAFIPVCTVGGGNSTNPIGDYCYVPAISSGNTVLILGGYAIHGALCGWCGCWLYSAGDSAWGYGARPSL